MIKKTVSSSLQQYFVNESAYWGIDKIVVTSLSVNPADINCDILSDIINTVSPAEMITFEPDIQRPISAPVLYDYFQLPFWKFTISDKRYGELRVRKSNNTTTTTLSLPNCENEVNIPTVGIAGLHLRLTIAQEFFHREYGVLFYTDVATIKEIEIAFTFATNGIIPLPVRIALAQVLAQDITPELKDPYSRSFDDPEKDYTIIIATLKKRHEHFKVVVYDKTAKYFFSLPSAERKNTYLTPDTPRVYRIELTLSGNYMLKTRLSTATMSELTDNAIIKFIQDTLSDGFTKYCEKHTKSIENANNMFHEVLQNTTSKNSNYREDILKQLLNNMQNHLDTGVIDIEAFLLAPLGGINSCNVARTKHRLLDYAFVKENNTNTGRSFLARLDGWETENIFSLMFNTVEAAQLNGLGSLETTENSIVTNIDQTAKMYKVKYGQYTTEEKKYPDFLEWVIKHSRVIRKLSSTDLLSLRMEMWSLPMFNTNQLVEKISKKLSEK